MTSASQPQKSADAPEERIGQSPQPPSAQTGHLPREPQEQDPIDEASAESFPASDPPAFTGSTATPSSDSTSQGDEAPTATARHPA